MANFNTHVNVAAAVVGSITLTLFAANVIESTTAFLITVCGLLGGILPDIDSDNAHPLKIITPIVFVTTLTLWVMFLDELPIIQLFIAATIYWGLFYYLVVPLFKKFTKHRGLTHSIPVGIIFATLTVTILKYMYNTDNQTAWLGGILLLIGFYIHLLLDELYSVDFSNRAIKRSFGTAFKLYNKKDIPSSLIVWATALYSIYATKGKAEIYNLFFTADLYKQILHNLY